MWKIFTFFSPAYFLSAPGSAWQAALKKTKVKLDLLIDTRNGYVINGRKGIRAGMHHPIYWYAKAIHDWL